jgi:hypothetical protein
MENTKAFLFSFAMLLISTTGMGVFLALLLTPHSVLDTFSVMIGLSGAVISSFVVFYKGIYSRQGW